MLRPLAALLLAAGALLAAPAVAAQEADPAVRLDGASLDEARQVALDAAARRGWSAIAVEPRRITLEQTLPGPAPRLERPAETLVRVYATFLPDGDDVLVQVQAIRIDAPETPTERRTDLTGPYRDNLMNALRALQGHWASRFTVLDPPPRARPAARPGQAHLGTWAYYAERYAEARGCRLADAGAELLDADSDAELHRVPCRDGTAILVRCHLGECGAAR